MEQARQRSAEEAYEAFCAGDESGFDQLMREFQQSLTCFLLGYVRAPDVAEDLAEETFVELLLHKGRFRGQSTFKTYLYSVARHKAIDHLRKEKRRPTVALDDVAERGDGAPGPEEQVIAGELAAQVARAIRAIPAEYREVMRLLYLEQMRYEEVAMLTRKSKKQVDNLAYRGRQLLKISLGREAIDFEDQ